MVLVGPATYIYYPLGGAPVGGGRPPRGPRRGAWGSPERLYKAPTDYTKPQQTILRPKILDETLKKYAKPKNIRQAPNILNKSSK